MSFYEQMVESDLNPFILFSKEGKVLSLNRSAQFLLGSVPPSILFKHTLNHATTSFGFKTTNVELSFGHFHFFAVNVGYENEDELGVMFYRKPSMEPKIDSSLQSEYEPINIYSVIDLCISATSIGAKRTVTRDFDPTLPDIRINTSRFIKMLSSILNACETSSEILIKLFIKIGEHIKIGDKKFSIFEVSVSSDNDLKLEDKDSIEKLGSSLGAKISIEASKVTVALAIIS